MIVLLAIRRQVRWAYAGGSVQIMRTKADDWQAPESRWKICQCYNLLKGYLDHLARGPVPQRWATNLKYRYSHARYLKGTIIRYNKVPQQVRHISKVDYNNTNTMVLTQTLNTTIYLGQCEHLTRSITTHGIWITLHYKIPKAAAIQLSS